jgi:lipopolysaccharide/colanic/teichoic acid biosynthesis glycosyltransferase
VKFIFDKIFSLVGLIVFAPIFLLLAILIKLFSNGPIIYNQKRVGQYGKLFNIYKFRTMYLNTDENSISVKGDKRITKLGVFLRKYKLDELPELWNVFIGDMSFVGPRPDVPGYADKLNDESVKVLLLKPGITGPASLKYIKEEEILASVSDPIKYNNEVIFPDKVKINLEYYENHNILFDIKIIIKTILRKN